MGRTVRVFSALAAGTLAFVVGTSTAHAILSPEGQKCQAAIGKEGLKFIQGQLKIRSKCIEANLKEPGSCTGPDSEALGKLSEKLSKGITKKCTFDFNTPGNIRALGFPGQCSDPNPGDGFTLTDLINCIESSHEDIVTGTCGGGNNTGQACNVLADCPDQGPGTYCAGILGFEYDSTVTGAQDSEHLVCQKSVGKNSSKF
jgi:hypothetical protein